MFDARGGSFVFLGLAVLEFTPGKILGLGEEKPEGKSAASLFPFFVLCHMLCEGEKEGNDLSIPLLPESHPSAPWAG